jgi:hypothetical protein
MVALQQRKGNWAGQEGLGCLVMTHLLLVRQEAWRRGRGWEDVFCLGAVSARLYVGNAGLVGQGFSLSMSSARSGRCLRWSSREFLRSWLGRMGEMGVSSTSWGCCSVVSAITEVNEFNGDVKYSVYRVVVS